MKKIKFKMRRGEKASYYYERFDSERPEISMTGDGESAYLWIGGEHGPCYATLSGQKTLIKLANHILETVNPKSKKG
jgi:hypothetical protein